MDDICLGDVVRTRKKHPCGSDVWTVIRTGADIKIRCRGCGRIVMLDRAAFLKRRKALLSRGSGHTFPQAECTLPTDLTSSNQTEDQHD